jgi:hypothetical protein
MYPYMNEDAAWQRLQDMQREMENSRLFAEHTLPAAWHLAQWLGGRVWSFVLAARPAVRSADRLREEPDSASDAA